MAGAGAPPPQLARKKLTNKIMTNDFRDIKSPFKTYRRFQWVYKISTMIGGLWDVMKRKNSPTFQDRGFCIKGLTKLGLYGGNTSTRRAPPRSQPEPR
jgi:hypothetical protein